MQCHSASVKQVNMHSQDRNVQSTARNWITQFPMINIMATVAGIFNDLANA